jgi:hypothetical protein
LPSRARDHQPDHPVKRGGDELQILDVDYVNEAIGGRMITVMRWRQRLNV